MDVDSHGLDRVRRIPASDAIGDEAGRFTPWLASHIDLLSQAIGIELEMGDPSIGILDLIKENTEVKVGTYRLDIRAFTEDGRVVAIENQYGVSDHSHLGQVITYASGVAADVVVWIAESFTDPHLDAVRWLNARTDDICAVFALEIEFLAIGNSAPAPSFSVRERPSEWVKSTRSAASRAHWTRETFLDGIADPRDRERASELMDRVLADGRLWFGVRGTGGVNLHFRQNRGPISLNIRGDGRLIVTGLWNNWDRTMGSRAYEPVAEALGQDVTQPASGVAFSEVDIELLWAAVERTASLLLELPGVSAQQGRHCAQETASHPQRAGVVEDP